MWAILKKELKISFTSLRLYIVFTFFLILSGFFFYTSLKFFSVILETNAMRGLWEDYFDLLRLVLILMTPLLTMGVFAEEKKMGTLELLWTYPLKDWQILMGKFLACLCALGCMVGLNMLYPMLLGFYYSFPWQPLLAAYLGFFLLGVFFISCGIFISFLTENQIVAAVVSFSVFIFFWFLTWNEAAYSAGTLNFLLHISVFDRFKPFTQGIIVIPDILFFLMSSSFFLFMALKFMGIRNWR
jgi:ABC-2 type transport system permease protein